MWYRDRHLNRKLLLFITRKMIGQNEHTNYCRDSKRNYGDNIALCRIAYGCVCTMRPFVIYMGKTTIYLSMLNFSWFNFSAHPNNQAERKIKTNRKHKADAGGRERTDVSTIYKTYFHFSMDSCVHFCWHTHVVGPWWAWCIFLVCKYICWLCFYVCAFFGDAVQSRRMGTIEWMDPSDLYIQRVKWLRGPARS